MSANKFLVWLRFCRPTTTRRRGPPIEFRCGLLCRFGRLPCLRRRWQIQVCLPSFLRKGGCASAPFVGGGADGGGLPLLCLCQWFVVGFLGRSCLAEEVDDDSEAAFALLHPCEGMGALSFPVCESWFPAFGCLPAAADSHSDASHGGGCRWSISGVDAVRQVRAVGLCSLTCVGPHRRWRLERATAGNERWRRRGGWRRS